MEINFNKSGYFSRPHSPSFNGSFFPKSDGTVVLLCLLLTALLLGCDDSTELPGANERSQSVVAPPEMIERIQKTGWLEKRHTCASMAMEGDDYKDCIRVEAALLPPLDLAKRDHFSQHYNPFKYYKCRSETGMSNGGCTKFKLRRNEADPVWPYPEAPPIKWPEPPTPSVYRDEMSSEEYFEALCKSEAGKFVYRTVDNVEGVYQVRPRIEATDFVLQDRYVMENPYHYALAESWSMGAAYIGPNKKDNSWKYLFWESSLYEPDERWSEKYVHHSMLVKPSSEAKFIRYEGHEDGETKNIRKSYAQSLESQYGYVWRGISRPYDRVYGIAGGELAVVDLKSNEILGLWRGFLRSGTSRSDRVWWLAAHACPNIAGYSADYSEFIMTILKPVKRSVSK